MDGGEAALPEGPPSWPVSDPEIAAILASVYEDGSWGRYHGPHAERLQQLLAHWHEVDHVSLCASGTIAVELALRGLQVGVDDEVILAGYDFPGNFRAIENLGARPVLVDIAANSWCLDVEQLTTAISSRSRAIVVSHLHGGLVPMRQVMEFAEAHDLGVVEDACQSPGAMVDGRPAGSHGDAGVMSFGGSKLLTAGRGGAVLTSHADVHQRMKIYSERGNHAFPLSELQAAVLCPQVEKIQEMNALRRRRVRRLLECSDYPEVLRPIDCHVAEDPSWASSFYKLAWSYEPAALGGVPRARFLAAVRAEGVALDEGFRGFLKRGSRRCRVSGELAASAMAAERTVILHHPVLLEPEATMQRVAAAIGKVVRSWKTS